MYSSFGKHAERAKWKKNMMQCLGIWRFAFRPLLVSCCNMTTLSALYSVAHWREINPLGVLIQACMDTLEQSVFAWYNRTTTAYWTTAAGKKITLLFRAGGKSANVSLGYRSQAACKRRDESSPRSQSVSATVKQAAIVELVTWRGAEEKRGMDRADRTELEVVRRWAITAVGMHCVVSAGRNHHLAVSPSISMCTSQPQQRLLCVDCWIICNPSM